MPNYTQKAIQYVEKHGIYNYTVQGNKLTYISYYGSIEGFYKVVVSLDTMRELSRKHQNTTIKPYNYMVG